MLSEPQGQPIHQNVWGESHQHQNQITRHRSACPKAMTQSYNIYLKYLIILKHTESEEVEIAVTLLASCYPEVLSCPPALPCGRLLSGNLSDPRSSEGSDPNLAVTGCHGMSQNKVPMGTPWVHQSHPWFIIRLQSITVIYHSISPLKWSWFDHWHPSFWDTACSAPVYTKGRPTRFAYFSAWTIWSKKARPVGHRH